MSDTIAALATAPGMGGIAVVRVSGPGAENALQKLFSGRPPYEDRKMMVGRALDQEGAMIDECMAVMMRAPRTYTREDVAEFHLHGGAFASAELLRALAAIGVRPAEPGEFTKRAFLNGRIDLSRAEAVMRLISAESGQAARSALRQLKGGVNSFVEGAMDRVLRLLAGVEAALDYPDEVDEEEACGSLSRDAEALKEDLERACDERAAGLMDQGLTVAILGPVNAGKSSLMNALSGQDRAIVTDIPGTTRDIVTAAFFLNGVKVTLWDTAGMRETSEAVELLGIQRARDAAGKADLVLIVADLSAPEDPAVARLIQETDNRPQLIVMNKRDLPPRCPVPEGENVYLVSARTGEGLKELRDAIGEYTRLSGGEILVSQRHIALAREAAEALADFSAELKAGQALDVSCVYLRQALDALGRITGERVDEKLLDEVFSTFCVGK